MTGLRGTGKTVLLREFAARAERAGWLTLHRELGDRGRARGLFACGATPVMSLMATPDGRTVYVGSGDGIFRSDDGGSTWNATSYTGQAFALATTPDGQVVGAVSRETEFFRSTDGGETRPGPG